MDINTELQEKVYKLFEEGRIERFIGYEKGSLPYKTKPCIIRKKEDVRRLIFNQFCVNNLSIYLRGSPMKTGILANTCTLRSITMLIQQKQVNPENLFVIAVNCAGMADKEGNILDKCKTCNHELPKIYNELIGEEITVSCKPGDEYNFITELEKLPVERRWEFWNKEFEKCVRCYACRNICPVCFCRECVADKTITQWVSKLNQSSTNEFYNLMRIMHVLGRCTDCGECERVCPVKIPFRKILKKMEKEIREKYGYIPGRDPSEAPPLTTFKEGDPEEGIK
ncbi:MAG: 4Fe-4S dicluster domain-containing protein [bacterium]